MKKIIGYFVILLAVIEMTACGASDQNLSSPTAIPLPKIFVAEGHLVPQNKLMLTFTVRGKVSEILVSKGQKVTAGQVLIRLADQEQTQASLAGAQLEQVQARQAYDTFLRTSNLANAQAWQAYIKTQQVRAVAERLWDALDLNAIKDEISNSQAEVNTRKAELDDAQKEFDKFKDLADTNTTRKTAEDKLTLAQKNYNEALRKLEESTNKRESVRSALDAALGAEAEAERSFENTLAGADPDTLALLEARLKAANAQVAAAQFLLGSYELKAPFEGIVTDINIIPGQQVGPETWVISLADFSQWYVDTSDLSELDVVKVEIGQQVEVTADALPGQTMLGTVEEIAQNPNNLAGDILYTVHIRVQEVDTRLRWGMTVEVTFPDK